MYNLEYNGQVVSSFLYPIDRVVEIAETIIILLDVPSNAIYNENIYCITKDGEPVWQIEKTRPNNVESPYVNIYLSNDKLMAVNYDGWTEEVNISSGHIVNSKFSK